MEKLTLQWLAQATQGELRGGSAKRTKAVVRAVSTDSRSIPRGALFVALKGDRFDGHSYMALAAARGAAAALVCREFADGAESRASRIPLIVVGDTLAALQAAARTYRRQQLKNMRAIAVTGSNGKTTTKEAIATVMTEKFKVVKSEGNLNNHIGVPLSVLRADADDELGVFELGINHPNELPPLVDICNPQVGVITNIGEAHLEFFGDKSAVADEKGKLIEALPTSGCAVLNADDECTPKLRERTRAKVITAGFAAEADVRAENVHWEKGKLCFDLHFEDETEVPEVWLDAVGKHQVYSPLFAAAVAREFGLNPKTVARALKKFQPPESRLRLQRVGGTQLIDDSYNANPDSMIASLNALASLPKAKRRIALLGDMAELGAASERGHRAVGSAAAQSRLDALLVVGEQSRWIAEAAKKGGLIRTTQFGSASEAGAALARLARRGDAILVKASRATKLEDAIAVFRKNFSKKV